MVVRKVPLWLCYSTDDSAFPDRCIYTEFYARSLQVRVYYFDPEKSKVRYRIVKPEITQIGKYKQILNYNYIKAVFTKEIRSLLDITNFSHEDTPLRVYMWSYGGIRRIQMSYIIVLPDTCVVYPRLNEYRGVLLSRN